MREFEALQECLVLISYVRNMLTAKDKLSYEEQAALNKAHELLVLCGDPLAPKTPLGMMNFPKEVKENTCNHEDPDNTGSCIKCQAEYMGDA